MNIIVTLTMELNKETPLGTMIEGEEVEPYPLYD